jgi:hypothetical protein
MKLHFPCVVSVDIVGKYIRSVAYADSLYMREHKQDTPQIPDIVRELRVSLFICAHSCEEADKLNSNCLDACSI